MVWHNRVSIAGLLTVGLIVSGCSSTISAGMQSIDASSTQSEQLLIDTDTSGVSNTKEKAAEFYEKFVNDLYIYVYHNYGDYAELSNPTVSDMTSFFPVLDRVQVSDLDEGTTLNLFKSLVGAARESTVSDSMVVLNVPASAVTVSGDTAKVSNKFSNTVIGRGSELSSGVFLLPETTIVSDDGTLMIYYSEDEANDIISGVRE